jgi:hypothetical protein
MIGRRAQVFDKKICLAPVLSNAATTTSDRATLQLKWQQHFAQKVFGALPSPLDKILISKREIQGDTAQVLILELAVADRLFNVHAALWLPKSAAPKAVICALDFIGPAGVSSSPDIPLDTDAVAYSDPRYGLSDGRLHDNLRGTQAPAWPVQKLTQAGFAVLLSGYG